MNNGIFALATGYTKSAIAVIRIAKKDLLGDLIDFIDKKSIKPRFATLIKIFGDKENKKIIDNCILIYFEKDKSYCGIDTIELHVHGSLFVIKEIYELLESLGYREAEPGEFSKLAVIHGKMNLIQAEAINNLINAETQQAYENSKNLGKDFTKKLNYFENLILSISSFLEASLEYPEEELDSQDEELKEVYKKFDILQKEIDKILENSSYGISLHSRYNIVIVGPTNSGKSSLFNLLLKEDRSIVSDVHGTTRDYIESELLLGNLHLSLFDTAGIRNSDDKIEQLGIKRVKKLIEDADLIIFLIAVDSLVDKELIEIFLNYTKKILVVLNKIDLVIDLKDNLNKLDYLNIKNEIINSNKIEKNTKDFILNLIDEFIFISVEYNFGIKFVEEKLKKSLEITIGNVDLQEDRGYEFIQTVRQKVLLEEVLNYINEAEKFLKEKNLFDISAENLKNAYLKINELTGKEYSKELFDLVFSKFCLGK